MEASNRKPRTSGVPLPLKAAHVWAPVCGCLCWCLLSLLLLVSGTRMQTELETTGLVVTRKSDTGLQDLTAHGCCSDSISGRIRPRLQAALQLPASVGCKSWCKQSHSFASGHRWFFEPLSADEGKLCLSVTWPLRADSQNAVSG